MYKGLHEASPSLGLLWLVGCSTGYRVSDLLLLRVSDTFSGTLHVVETKTGKLRIMRLPKRVYEAINDQIQRLGLERGDYLFFGKTRDAPITRQHAHRVMRSVGLTLGLESIGTHSMRKTYAYNVLLATKSFDRVKMSLNHAYLSTTILYLIDGLTALLPKSGRLGIPPSSVVATALPG